MPKGTSCRALLPPRLLTDLQRVVYVPEMVRDDAGIECAEGVEEAPLVAALVQRGLLKTRDVLNPVYVQAMEKRLREQEITREVEGRDPRYRPRTARQAYRPPVNVVQTGQSG